jgi:hypothetical protein
MKYRGEDAYILALVTKINTFSSRDRLISLTNFNPLPCLLSLRYLMRSEPTAKSNTFVTVSKHTLQLQLPLPDYVDSSERDLT